MGFRCNASEHAQGFRSRFLAPVSNKACNMPYLAQGTDHGAIPGFCCKRMVEAKVVACSQSALRDSHGPSELRSKSTSAITANRDALHGCKPHHLHRSLRVRNNPKHHQKNIPTDRPCILPSCMQLRADDKPRLAPLHTLRRQEPIGVERIVLARRFPKPTQQRYSHIQAK